MANDPPFAALNHVVSDSKIPKESDNRRVGISNAVMSAFEMGSRLSKKDFEGVSEQH